MTVQKLRMVRAYLRAVLAGSLAFDIIILTMLLFTSLFYSKDNWEAADFSSGLAGYLFIAISALALQYAVSSIIAAPLALLCSFLNEITWKSTHINSVLVGILCAMETLCVMIFITPTSLDIESYRFNEVAFMALAVCAASIMSGAIAGSVFWRLGLRPEASTRARGAKL